MRKEVEELVNIIELHLGEKNWRHYIEYDDDFVHISLYDIKGVKQ